MNGTDHIVSIVCKRRHISKHSKKTKQSLFMKENNGEHNVNELYDFLI